MTDRSTLDPARVSLPALIGALRAVSPSARATRRARMLVADTLGCIAAGFAAEEVSRLADRLSPGRTRWPGAPAALATSDAALVGAVAACWDEGCEGLARAHGRPGVAAIAAVVPLVQERDGTLGDALDAICFGYEVGGRLGEVMRIRPGMHVDATWPSLGAAAAAAHALDHDDARVLAAVNLAACQVPVSLYLPIAQGATGRNLYLGHAARLGLDCAIAIKAGIGAPLGAVAESWRIGFAGDGALPLLAAPSLSLIEEGYLKPYAAVRHVHYGAAAAGMLRAQVAGRLQEIERIELEIYGEALTYCGNRAPDTSIQAQFSLSFGIAAMLLLGDLGPDAYRQLGDPRLRALEAKVTLLEDRLRSERGVRGATLRVLIAGETLVQTVDAVAGDTGLAMSEGEVQAKFMRYAGRALDSSRAARLFESVVEAPLHTPLRSVLDR